MKLIPYIQLNESTIKMFNRRNSNFIDAHDTRTLMVIFLLAPKTFVFVRCAYVQSVCSFVVTQIRPVRYEFYPTV